MDSEDQALMKDIICELQKNAEFEIRPADDVNYNDSNLFSKLSLNQFQMSQLNSAIRGFAEMDLASSLASAYYVKFPQGLPHTLTALHQGGFGSMIRENNKFVGSASFYPMEVQALLLKAFTLMSAVTGQYFLSQINNQMQKMNMKLDEILEFLYGDKKAELISEMTFVTHAYQNYVSIMSHDEQRKAIIVSLQESRKVALKDIEFFISDLDNKANQKTSNYWDISQIVDKSLQSKDSLELAEQLYVMSGILECFYAQNLDDDYISRLKEDVHQYLKKCDRRILTSFSNLKGKVDGYRPLPFENVNKTPDLEKLGKIIDSLNLGEESDLQKSVNKLLQAQSEESVILIKNDGNAYIKKSL